MAYPAQEEKGFATALFWILFNSGAVVGGLLTLLTNYHAASAAAPSTTTLVCFLSVMLGGTALTALLVPPERVLRRDGRRVNTVSAPHGHVEARPPARACLLPIAEAIAALVAVARRR